MDFAFVTAQMITVSLPILVGWAARKLGFMDNAFDTQLSRLILNIGLPCMILASLATSQGLPSPADMLWAIVGETILLVIAAALGYGVTALMRVPNGAEGVYRFAITFSNCGLIGFPIISAVLGSDALLIAAIGLIPVNLIMFTVGVLMFSGGEGEGLGKQLRRAAQCLKSPTLLASIAVLLCSLMRFTDFGLVGTSLDLIGQMTTPLALLVTGSALASYKPLDMLTNMRAYIACICRLVVAPLVGLVALRLLPIDANVIAILVLEAAMPVGTNGILYCLQYGVDTKPMVQCTFLTIVCAILSIPVVTTLALG